MRKLSRYLIVNRDLVSYEEATIPVFSCAMKYGASVFEGIRGYWNEEVECMNILCLEKHIDRLLLSAKLMQFHHEYCKSTLLELILKVVVKNNLKEDCYIRCALSAIGEDGIGSTGPIMLSIDAFPQGRKPYYKKGLHLSITSWQRINEAALSPKIKCISNYHNARLALLEARKSGYDDVLFLSRNGYITEASTAIIFFSMNGILITPKLSDDILDSITRKLIFHLGEILNIEVREEHVFRTMAYMADEAFLCGTGAEILPIISIDRYPLNSRKPMNITSKIQKKYEELTMNKIDECKQYIYQLSYDTTCIYQK